MRPLRPIVICFVLLSVVAGCGPGATGSTVPTSGTPTSAPASSGPPAAELPALALKATIDGFRGAASVTATSDAIWVLDHRAPTVVRIDPKTDQVTARIELGTGFANGLGLAGGRLWTFHQTAGEVVGIDPKTAKVVATLQLGEDGDLFWVGDDAAWLIARGNLFRIDGATAKVVTLPLDGACGVAGAAAGDGFVWFGSASGGLCKIDASSGAVVDRGAVAGNGSGIAVVNGSPWLAGADNGLSIVDPATLDATAIPPPPSGTFQGGKYSLGLAGGETTVIVGDPDGSGGWLRYTGGAIGRILLTGQPLIVLYAGFPGGSLAGGVVVAFDSLWVTNFDGGSVTRYALPTP